MIIFVTCITIEVYFGIIYDPIKKHTKNFEAR